jgi:hypothetical protein
MNEQTKPQCIMALSKILRDAPGTLSSPRLLEQCRSFSYREDREMGALAGAHDDLVIAAAIAFAVRAQAGDPQLAFARL